MTAAKTIYPSLGDYNLSVSHLDRFAQEPRLRTARPQRMPNGSLVAYSGGYSRVYPVQGGSATYALRCWTADVGDARERYRRIGAYLAGQRMPWFVEFEYLEDALVVKGQRYPVLWMEWAEGPRLRDFIAQNLHDPPVLRRLADAFREMAAALHAAGISHGDLQDENIIVQHGPSGPRLRLIDYDSLYVPSLSGYADQIIGVSHYQHPRRNLVRTASERVDHFSELVIYLSLLVYEQNPSLWDERGEKQLLFADTDFLAPERSRVLQQVRFMTGEVRALANRLMDFCREGDPTGLEPLEAVLSAIPAGGGASAPRKPGGLGPDFLRTPESAPSAPPAPRVSMPDGFLRTPPVPDPAPTPARIPADFLATTPAPAAPEGLPDDSLAFATRAGTDAPAGREALFALPARGEGASAEMPVLAAPVVASAPEPAARMPVAETAAPFAPPLANTPLAAAAVAPPSAARVDWGIVGRGFAFGIILFLLIVVAAAVVMVRAGEIAIPLVEEMVSAPRIPAPVAAAADGKEVWR